MSGRFQPGHKLLVTHGMSKAPEYRVWCGMIQRCTNPKELDYPRYGGRGIRVCAEWREDFAAFFEHVGPRPSTKHQLDRIDANGNYEPGNVRWATPTEQQRNKRNTAWITAHGLTLSQAEWSERTGLGQSTIWYRIRSGWSPERAVSEPRTPNDVRVARSTAARKAQRKEKTG